MAVTSSSARSTVSRHGVSPGRQWNSVSGRRRSPAALNRARAPIRIPPSDRLATDARSGMRLISSTRSGAATPRRSQLSNSVPPARIAASVSASVASAGSSAAARAYPKPRISVRPARRVGRRPHRLDDLRIASTTAEIAAHPLADLAVGSRVVLVDAGNCRYHLAGRAVAALKGVVVDEGLLDGMQPIALGEPLDRDDLAAIDGGRQHHAGSHPAAVEQ